VREREREREVLWAVEGIGREDLLTALKGELYFTAYVSWDETCQELHWLHCFTGAAHVLVAARVY
jgi:hypothetical protein